MRKDFNAMRLLLASSFELIDLENNADEIVSQVNTKKSLLYEIFETKSFTQ